MYIYFKSKLTVIFADKDKSKRIIIMSRWKGSNKSTNNINKYYKSLNICPEIASADETTLFFLVEVLTIIDIL